MSSQLLELCVGYNKSQVQLHRQLPRNQIGFQVLGVTTKSGFLIYWLHGLRVLTSLLLMCKVGGFPFNVRKISSPVLRSSKTVPKALGFNRFKEWARLWRDKGKTREDHDRGGGRPHQGTPTSFSENLPGCVSQGDESLLAWSLPTAALKEAQAAQSLSALPFSLASHCLPSNNGCL